MTYSHVRAVSQLSLGVAAHDSLTINEGLPFLCLLWGSQVSHYEVKHGKTQSKGVLKVQ